MASNVGKRHYLSEHNTLSICEATGEVEVFRHGADDGPNTFCTACHEPDPEWIFIEDSEYDQMTR